MPGYASPGPPKITLSICTCDRYVPAEKNQLYNCLVFEILKLKNLQSDWLRAFLHLTMTI